VDRAKTATRSGSHYRRERIALWVRTLKQKENKMEAYKGGEEEK
jgi:hypothetical protein